MIEFSEKDLEDWIYANPSSVGMDRWIGRQVALPSGIADLIGVCDESIWVVELKAVSLNAAAIMQVCRYAADVQLVVGGNISVNKLCVGLGEISSQLLLEANAVDVDLRLVTPCFAITNKYSFTKEWNCKFAYKLHALRSSPEFWEFCFTEKIEILLHDQSKQLSEEKLKIAACIAKELELEWLLHKLEERKLEAAT